MQSALSKHYVYHLPAEVLGGDTLEDVLLKEHKSDVRLLKLYNRRLWNWAESIINKMPARHLVADEEEGIANSVESDNGGVADGDSGKGGGGSDGVVGGDQNEDDHAMAEDDQGAREEALNPKKRKSR